MNLCERHQMMHDIGRTFEVHPYYPVSQNRCVVCSPPIKVSRSLRKYLWRKRRNLATRRRKTHVSPLLDVYLCGEISRISEILNNKHYQRGQV